tara:strand:- start:617 stop:940 length:324 start_codon:yes stop_codon:yes gene_type:complete
MSDTCSVEFGEIDLSQQNPTLTEVVDSNDSALKDMLVEYVGNAKKPENNEVTIDLIVEVMSEEFPECVLALAEENYIRGYQQALNDVDTGQKLYQEEMAKQQNEQSD